MEGPDERIDARDSATYTVREAKRWSFINHARDHAWQAESCEQSATTSNQRHPH
jgi:hypothetical protein